MIPPPALARRRLEILLVASISVGTQSIPIGLALLIIHAAIETHLAADRGTSLKPEPFIMTCAASAVLATLMMIDTLIGRAVDITQLLLDGVLILALVMIVRTQRQNVLSAPSQ